MTFLGTTLTNKAEIPNAGPDARVVEFYALPTPPRSNDSLSCAQKRLTAIRTVQGVDVTSPPATAMFFGEAAGETRHAAGFPRWPLFTASWSLDYIDYTLALCYALQFRVQASVERDGVLARYVALCERGGEAPLRELVRSAGLRQPFDERTLEDVGRARLGATFRRSATGTASRLCLPLPNERWLQTRRSRRCRCAGGLPRSPAATRPRGSRRRGPPAGATAPAPLRPHPRHRTEEGSVLIERLPALNDGDARRPARRARSGAAAARLRRGVPAI
jgi:hypothetical protein